MALPGFANRRTKLKHSKAMDVRLYWVQDWVEQDQFGEAAKPTMVTTSPNTTHHPTT
jgi:hypothetical protein